MHERLRRQRRAKASSESAEAVAAARLAQAAKAGNAVGVGAGVEYWGANIFLGGGVPDASILGTAPVSSRSARSLKRRQHQLQALQVQAEELSGSSKRKRGGSAGGKGSRVADGVGGSRSSSSSDSAVAGNSDEILAINQLSRRAKNLAIFHSSIHDYGVFTMDAIEAGQMVIEYVGEYVRTSVADKREKAYEKSGIGSSYLFRVDKDLIIDATYKGQMPTVLFRVWGAG